MEKACAAGVAMSTDKADSRTNTMIRDREGHYTTEKGSIQNEDIAILNVHAPNNRAGKRTRIHNGLEQGRQTAGQIQLAVHVHK